MAKKELKLTKSEIEEITAHVKDLKPRLLSKFSNRNKRIEDVDSHRWKTNVVTIPDAYAANITPYHSPLSFDYCRRVPSIFGDAIPQVSIPPSRPGAEAQDDSTDSEDFWQGFVERLIQERDITGRLKDSLPNRGGAVWKCILKRDDWFHPPEQETDEDEKAYNKRSKEWRKGIFPFTWDYVPTDTYYPVTVNGEVKEVLEITRREAFDIAKKYKLSRGNDGLLRDIGDRTTLATTGECEFMEFCDKNRYAYFVDDEFVDGGRHNYGAVYYFGAPATMSSSTRPEDEWLPFAWPLVAAQDELETAVSMYKNWAYMNAFPTPIIYATSPDASGTYEKNAVITLKPGEVYQPEPGWDIKYMEAPGVHGDLKGYTDRMDREAETLALASILQGTGPGAGTPGVTAAMQLTVAHSQFDPAGESYAHAWDRFYEFVMRVIDIVLIDPVAVWYDGKKWVERGADDIKGYYRCKHSMNPVIPAEMQLELNLNLQLYDRKLIPGTEVLEAAGRHDPEKHMALSYVEDKLRDPRIDNAIMQKTFEQLGIPDTVTPPGTAENPIGGNSGAGIIPLGNPQGPMGTSQGEVMQ